ncbi:MAG TPA: leucine-rich repeat domain-containing protein, partial [Kofleriaceae bacterium]|nr:leucine-rich repeat domain-containing protein [Kofleriaceae bacterium]
MSHRIVRAEADYDRGCAIAFRYFDREGRAVAFDGTPLAERPPSVPPEAMQDRGEWIAGRFTEAGTPVGRVRRWSAHGGLLAEEIHGDGTVAATTYHPGGGVRARFGMRGGKLDGVAETWRRDGTLARRAAFVAGAHAGPTEDFARDGARVRLSEPGPPRLDAPAPPPLPPDDAQALDGGAATALSPVGMAYAIARGWGSDESDVPVARRHRAVALALAPPSLAALFAELGLDRSARLPRLDRAVRELAADPAVDGEALAAVLAETGATGLALGLATERADRLLHARVRDGRLALSHLALEELPRAIGRFPGLRELDVSHNRLRALPAEVADVFRLQRIDLTRNRIEALPRELAWLPELRTLLLASNGLEAIPPVVLELEALATLALGDNLMTVLPDAMGDLAALRSLQLYDNRLADLPRALTRLDGLRELHLGGHGWAEPPAVIAQLASLEELWLASPALRVLPAAVCKLPRLRRLIVWSSSLRELPPELYECTQLTELRVRDNPLPDGTLDRLREALPGCTIS